MSAPIFLTVTIICMHSLQTRTLIPSGNANSTGQRGPLKSVILQQVSILFGTFLSQFAPVIWTLLIWHQLGCCMSSEVQFSILQCSAIFWGKKIYSWAHFWSKKFNGIKLSGLSKNLFRRKCWLQPKPETSADNILKMSIHAACMVAALRQ